MDSIDNFTLVQIIVYGVAVVSLFYAFWGLRDSKAEDKKPDKS